MGEKKQVLLDQILKAYTFNGLSDQHTIIRREDALNSKDVILKLRNMLIAEYPKAYTIKLRAKKELTSKDLVTVLRQIVRYHSHRIISSKKWKWNRETKRQECVYQYRLL